MLSKATGNGIPEGDKHRLWLLVMAEPVSPGEGMEGWFRLGAQGSIGFIPSSCASVWLLVMAEPVSPGEGMEGWFRLGAEGSIGFIPSSCAVGPQGVSSGMISGSSEGSDLY